MSKIEHLHSIFERSIETQIEKLTDSQLEIITHLIKLERLKRGIDGIE